MHYWKMIRDSFTYYVIEYWKMLRYASVYFGWKTALWLLMTGRLMSVMDMVGLHLMELTSTIQKIGFSCAEAGEAFVKLGAAIRKAEDTATEEER